MVEGIRNKQKKRKRVRKREREREKAPQHLNNKCNESTIGRENIAGD